MDNPNPAELSGGLASLAQFFGFVLAVGVAAWSYYRKGAPERKQSSEVEIVGGAFADRSAMGAATSALEKAAHSIGELADVQKRNAEIFERSLANIEKTIKNHGDDNIRALKEAARIAAMRDE